MSLISAINHSIKNANNNNGSNSSVISRSNSRDASSMVNLLSTSANNNININNSSSTNNNNNNSNNIGNGSSSSLNGSGRGTRSVLNRNTGSMGSPLTASTNKSLLSVGGTLGGLLSSKSTSSLHSNLLLPSSSTSSLSTNNHINNSSSSNNSHHNNNNVTGSVVAGLDCTLGVGSGGTGNGIAVVPLIDGKRPSSNIPSLVCAFLASGTTGGTTYAFGLYAAALKKSLKLSQSQLDTISSCFFFAGLFSFLPGYCSDKFGTRIALTAGGFLQACSLLLYWMVATQYIEVSRDMLVPVLSMLGVCIFLSSALITGAVFKILVACCDVGTKGSAVGIAKGYVGLGAGLYACIFESIRTKTVNALPKSDLDFLLMAACFSISCVTIPGVILLPTKVRMQTDIFIDESTKWHYRTLFVSLFTMGSLVAGSSLLALSDITEPTGTTRELELGPGASYDPAMVVFGTSSQNNDDDDKDHGRYGSAILLVSIWAGPILSLLYLPRDRNYSSNNSTSLSNVIVPDDVDESTVDMTVTTDYSSTQTSGSDEEPTLGNERVRRRTAVVPDTESVPDIRTSWSSEAVETVIRPPRSPKGGALAKLKEARNLTKRKGGFVEVPDYDDEDRMEDLALRHDDEITRRQGNGNGIGIGNDNSDDNHNNSNALSQEQEGKNLLQMLQTPTALIMLLTATILVGAGTVITNNIGQMVEALGFEAAVTPAATAIFSVAQATGRIVCGALSESALNWQTSGRCCIDNGIPRPFFFAISAAFASLAHFIMAYARREYTFVVGSAIAGLSFGMVWPLLVLVVGELFGPKNVGANYMFFDGFTSAAGTLLFSKIVAQYVYESHIDSRTSPDEHTCIGIGCFQTTFLVISALSFLCMMTSSCLMYSSRHVYNKVSFHTIR